MSNIDITVIMGIYNCEDTLSEAIDSLLGQTFKNWKLIMCDDCSTDNTYNIAKKYCDKYGNIQLVRNDQNKGLNFTLNKCLEYVDTEFVARMDGDDISLPIRFEKEINFLKENSEFSIVSCNMIYFDENGDFGESNSLQNPKKEDFVYGTPFCHAPCLVRTTAYREVNGYSVSKRLLRVEDYHLWYKMYLAGFKGYNLNESLYKMRDDRNAVSRRKFLYRINEAYVRYLVVKNYKLKKINYLHVLKPILVGILPLKVYNYLHKKKLKNK